MSKPNVPAGTRRQHARFLHPRLSALFLTAPGDGVAPSILLTVYDTKKKPLAQYLYNISEGTSRLMLEHKARPDPRLKAVFLSGCSPAEAGGLGSVVLRLKQDGHALLHLVGPQGEFLSGDWSILQGCPAVECCHHAQTTFLQTHKQPMPASTACRQLQLQPTSW
jgi:hypothetical protein